MLKGIDISEHQQNIDFTKLKNQIDFIIIRSSYGNGFADKCFTNNKNLARQNAIPCGFYHYAYPQYNSPEEEACWFLQTANVQKGEFLCLDFEERWSGDPVLWCKKFLDYITNSLNGYRCLIYLNLSTVRSYDWSPLINAGYGLWLADWDNNPNNPVQNTPWPKAAIRQYTARASFNGVNGNVDADIFYGDLNGLKSYCFGSNGGFISNSPKILLPIPPVSQRDLRWSNQRLGTVNGTTIGSHGCIISDMAMLATYYGHPISPNTLDDILTNRNLYYDGNLFVNGSITNIFSDIFFDKVVYCETTAAPVNEICEYLNSGKPCVVALINQGIKHYVLAVGFEGERIYCNDPWMGDQIAINDRWGDPKIKILQINFFSGPVPVFQIPGVVPQPIQPVTIPSTNPPQLPPITSTNPTPAPTSSPANVSVPPIDTTTIQDLINRGLLEVQNSIAEIAYNNSISTTVQKSTNQIFIDSLKSRKFILSALASLTALVNSTFKLGLTQDQLMIFILPVLSYLIVEGGADIVTRFKSAP